MPNYTLFNVMLSEVIPSGIVLSDVMPSDNMWNIVMLCR